MTDEMKKMMELLSGTKFGKDLDGYYPKVDELYAHMKTVPEGGLSPIIAWMASDPYGDDEKISAENEYWEAVETACMILEGAGK